MVKAVLRKWVLRCMYGSHVMKRGGRRKAGPDLEVAELEGRGSVRVKAVSRHEDRRHQRQQQHESHPHPGLVSLMELGSTQGMRLHHKPFGV